MGNAGEARLDVVAMGRDEVTVVMNKVNAELDALKSKLSGYEAAQRGTSLAAKEATSATGALVDKMGDLKKQAEPINKVREAFENLRSNAVFGVGAVIGIVAGLGEALGDLLLSWSDNAKAIDAWTKAQAKMADGLKETHAILADVRKLLGEPVPSELDQAYSRLRARAIEVAGEIEKGKRAVAAMREQFDLAATAVPALRIAQSVMNDEVAKNQGVINKLKAEQYSIDKASLDVISEQTRVSREFAQVLDYIAGKSKTLPASTKPFAPKPEEVVGNPFLGFGDQSGLSSKPLADAVRDAQNELRQRGGSKREQTREEGLDALFGRGKYADKPRPTGLSDIVDAGLAEPDANDKMIADMNERVRKPALGFMSILSKGSTEAERFEKALNGVTRAFNTFGDAVGDKAPELGSMFTDIASIWSGVQNNAKSLAGGVIGSLDAIGDASAQWFKTEKEQTRFLAAKEMLLSIPLWFIDPAQAAAKEASAIGLFALAGGGGGGGRGRAGAGGGGRASGASSSGGGSGGPSTIVNNVWNMNNSTNISALVTDPQRVTRAVSDAQRSSRGTGADAQRGA